MTEQTPRADDRVKFITVPHPDQSEWSAPLGWAAVLALLIVLWNGRRSSEPKTYAIIVALTVLGVAYLVAKWFAWLRKAKTNAKGILPASDNVICYLYQEQSKDFENIDDMVFEPIAMRWWSFFYAPRWILDRSKHGMAIWFAGVIVPVTVMGMTGNRFTYLAIVAILGTLGILPVLIRPRYIRISPGRVEELRAWFWQEDVVRTRDYDLTQARILVRLDRGYVAIENPDATLILNAAGIRESFTNACALIIRAKLAERHAYPNLPATTLLG